MNRKFSYNAITLMDKTSFIFIAKNKEKENNLLEFMNARRIQMVNICYYFLLLIITLYQLIENNCNFNFVYYYFLTRLRQHQLI